MQSIGLSRPLIYVATARRARKILVEVRRKELPLLAFLS